MLGEDCGFAGVWPSSLMVCTGVVMAVDGDGCDGTGWPMIDVVVSFGGGGCYALERGEEWS